VHVTFIPQATMITMETVFPCPCLAAHGQMSLTISARACWQKLVGRAFQVGIARHPHMSYLCSDIQLGPMLCVWLWVVLSHNIPSQLSSRQVACSCAVTVHASWTPSWMEGMLLLLYAVQTVAVSKNRCRARTLCLQTAALLGLLNIGC
jgi:hypothetical protein